MCSLIQLNLSELLDGNLSINETSGGEICRLELLKRLLVELGLELFKDVRELCSRRRQTLMEWTQRGKCYALSTRRLVAVSRLLTGAPRTIKGAARARREAKEGITGIWFAYCRS